MASLPLEVRHVEVDGYVAKTCHRKGNHCWILIREAAYRQILLGYNDGKMLLVTYIENTEICVRT